MKKTTGLYRPQWAKRGFDAIIAVAGVPRGWRSADNIAATFSASSPRAQSSAHRDSGELQYRARKSEVLNKVKRTRIQAPT